jgi:hypothetical protein
MEPAASARPVFEGVERLAPLRRNFTGRSEPGQVTSLTSDNMAVRTAAALPLGSTAVIPDSRPASPHGARNRSYDQASIEQFMVEAAAEQTRLRAEIRKANERLELAAAAAEPRLEAARIELGALVLAAHVQLTAIEGEYRDAITSVRDGAVAEAARVLAAARDQAIAARARAAKER